MKQCIKQLGNDSEDSDRMSLALKKVQKISEESIKMSLNEVSKYIESKIQ